MTDPLDDELRRRLTGLSADLDGVSLPGPSAARRRAAKRTRNQVTGGVLAGVAVVAGGVFAVGPSDLTATPEPAPPASLSTVNPEPTTATPGLDAALLTPADVAGDTGVEWTAAEAGPEIACDPAATIDTMSSILERAQAGFAAEAGEVRQDLVRFADGGSAAGVADTLLTCLDEESAGDGALFVSDTLALTGVGDEGWITRYYLDPADQQATVAVVAIVRSGDVVSVTVQTETTADTVGDVELDLAVPAAAAARLCDVLFGITCVAEPGTEDLTGADIQPESSADAPEGDPTGDPTGEPSDGPAEEAPDDEPTTPAEELLELAEDPFLTEADVASVGSATGFVRRPEMDVDFGSAPCLQDPMGFGAITVNGLGYNHDLDASIFEWVGQLPDADSAFQVVAAHTSLPDVCGEVDADREQTVGEPVAVEVQGADDAVVWTVESVPTADNPGSETSFAGLGVARVGNLVVAVAFNAMGDPSGGDWPGVATGLLASAIQRVAG